MNTWDNVAARIAEDLASGCWIWCGRRDRQGYGWADWAGKSWPAHRLVYSLLRSEVPRDRVMDHLCRTPWCVNPDHLEPVTWRENRLRGVPVKPRPKQDACKYGHPFAGENLLVLRDGERVCRQCNRDRQRRCQERRRAAS